MTQYDDADSDIIPSTQAKLVAAVDTLKGCSMEYQLALVAKYAETDPILRTLSSHFRMAEPEFGRPMHPDRCSVCPFALYLSEISGLNVHVGHSAATVYGPEIRMRLSRGPITAQVWLPRETQRAIAHLDAQRSATPYEAGINARA